MAYWSRRFSASLVAKTPAVRSQSSNLPSTATFPGAGSTWALRFSVSVATAVAAATIAASRPAVVLVKKRVGKKFIESRILFIFVD